MSNGYVTDPELLARLNSPEDEEGYVTDPSILNRLNAPAEPAEGRGAAAQAAVMAGRPAVSAVAPTAQAVAGAGKFAAQSAKDVYDIGRNLAGASMTGLKEMATHPIITAKVLAREHPIYGPAIEKVKQAATGMADESIRSLVGKIPGGTAKGMAALGRGLGTMALGPESIIALPYTMAAMEQEKIKADPYNPAYKNVPYAQVVRGEYPTQGAAGAANRRRAIYNTPSGYQLTAKEAENVLAANDPRMLEIYRESVELQNLIRRKAAQKALGNQQ